MSILIRTIVAYIIIGLPLSCSNNAYQATDTGGGSEITNGASAYVRQSDGTPVNNAQVFVRPQRFLRDTSSLDFSRIPDAYTDETGYFKIDSLKPDNYFIEVNDNHSYAVRLACTVSTTTKQVIDLGIDTLRPTGTVRGAITQSPTSPSIGMYVQIYGLDRIARVNAVTGTFSFDMLPAGNFSLHVLSSSPLIPGVDVDNIAVLAGDTATVPVAVWKSFRQLIFNTTSTGAQITGTVVNFPVLVRLTNSNFAFGDAKKNGEDVRFARSNGTPLPYEIERWDSANGQAELWVNVDTIVGNNQSRYMTMFWGNPNAVSGSNSAAVFDTSNGYQGVWHLGESGPLAKDATVNHYDGTLNSMPAAPKVAAGAIGNAFAFDGISSFIEMTGTASGKLDFSENGTYMVSAWVYADTLDGIHDEIVSKGWYQYFLEVGSNNTWEFNVLKGGVGWENSHSPATSKVWSYVVGIRSDTSQYLYVNGTCVDSIMKFGNRTPSLRSSADNFKIGTHSGASDPYPWFFKGKIDEVRILNSAPGADWVKLCYMNQKSTDALIVFK